jgi:hypothetical protein
VTRLAPTRGYTLIHGRHIAYGQSLHAYVAICMATWQTF